MLETRISLLRRVRNLADGRSWNEFHAIYRPLIFSYLRGLGVREHDAYDLTQEVFRRLMVRLPTFELDRGQGRFRSYLWKMARNALVAGIREKEVRDRAEEEWVRRSCEAEESESRRLARIDALEKRRKILEAVLPRARAKASKTAWKCFKGRVVHRRPVAEIAAELGITANTVSARSSEVMKDVRRLCAEIEGGEDDGRDLDPS
jgi:RNA polymerase sigma-70 factor (ECF subfamily)